MCNIISLIINIYFTFEHKFKALPFRCRTQRLRSKSKYNCDRDWRKHVRGLVKL